MSNEIRAGSNGSPLRARVRRHANGRSNTAGNVDRPAQLPISLGAERDPSQSFTARAREPLGARTGGVETQLAGRRLMTKVNDKVKFTHKPDHAWRLMRSVEMQNDGPGRGSGELSTSEMKGVLDTLNTGLTIEERDELVEKLDPAGSGRVNYREFLKELDCMQPLGDLGSVHREDMRVATVPWAEKKASLNAWNWKRHNDTLPGMYPAPNAKEQQMQDSHLVSLVSPKIVMNKHRLRMSLGCQNKAGDGQVDKETLVKSFEELKMEIPRPQVERLFDMLDTTNAGTIDFNYFVGTFDGGHGRAFQPKIPTKPADLASSGALLSEVGMDDMETVMRKPTTSLLQSRLQTKADAAKRVFSMRDGNRDGQLSLEELADGCCELVPGIDKRDVAALMLKVDPESDGSLNYRKFVEELMEGALDHPRTTESFHMRTQPFKRTSSGAPLRPTSTMSDGGLTSRGFWGESPLRTAPAMPTCVLSKSMSSSLDSLKATELEAPPVSTNGKVNAVIRSLMSSSPDLAASLRGSCPEFSRPQSEGAAAVSKPRTGKRFWPNLVHKDTLQLTTPAEGTSQASLGTDDHYMRKAGPGFLSFQIEDKTRKAKAHAECTVRMAAKAQFEMGRSLSDDLRVEAADTGRLAMKGLMQQRYEERAHLYERSRLLPQQFQADSSQSPLFTRDPFFASTGYEGVHGASKQYIHGLHGLLATN